MPQSSESTAISEYQLPDGRVESLLAYPGKRVDGSFITNGDVVTKLPDSFDEFVVAADETLTGAGLPLIAERYPVLAYGANANPVKMAARMKKFGALVQPMMQTVPYVMATIPDTAAVWHGRPGQGGGVFAELYRGPETEGTNLKAHISFLTKEQFAAVHDSEGATYAVAELEDVLIGNTKGNERVSVSAYVALDSQIAISHEGTPILVETIQHENTTLPRKSARDMVAAMLKYAGVESSVDEYITNISNLPLYGERSKKSIQARVGAQLLLAGTSRKFGFYAPGSNRLVGRTDFTSMPGGQDKQLQHIPEMALSKIRPEKSNAAERLAALVIKFPNRQESELVALIDPARKISRQAHDELAYRLALKQ